MHMSGRRLVPVTLVERYQYPYRRTIKSVARVIVGVGGS